LAAFYGDLLGGSVDSTDPSWCEVHFAPPEWPNGQPQQIHLD